MTTLADRGSRIAFGETVAVGITAGVAETWAVRRRES